MFYVPVFHWVVLEVINRKLMHFWPKFHCGRGDRCKSAAKKSWDGQWWLTCSVGAVLGTFLLPGTSKEEKIPSKPDVLPGKWDPHILKSKMEKLAANLGKDFLNHAKMVRLQGAFKAGDTFFWISNSACYGVLLRHQHSGITLQNPSSSARRWTFPPSFSVRGWMPSSMLHGRFIVAPCCRLHSFISL